MKKVTYKGHTIELESHKQRNGSWVPRATIIVDDGKAAKSIPIFGRRRASFETLREADACALELAKLWVDGRIWGGNGRY